MKNNFFSNTAPVIPTGASEAKRSGGISRLTHNTTIKVAAHVSRLLRLAMTVVLLSPVVLSAQNGVTVSNLSVNSGTVTFNVSWDKNSDELKSIVWFDSVWVFVDYNAGGVMKRLPLTGATLTATSAPDVGRVIQYPDNEKGVWVAGNAKTAPSGSFSATVKLLTATANVSGACAYASNYPPVAEYLTASSITFIGTPPYDLVLNTGQDTVYNECSLLPGQTLVSFSDKTGAPGIIKCIQMTGDLDFSVPDNVLKSQPASFAVKLPLVTSSSEIVYTWSAPDFVSEAYTGTSFNATAPAAAGPALVTLTARSKGYCDLSKTNEVTVIECIPPTTYTLLASSPLAFCESDAGATFSLQNTQSGVKYQLYKGTTPVGAELDGTGSAATFTGGPFKEAGVYTAKSVADGLYCAVLMSGSHTITANATPTVTGSADASRCGDGTVTLSATASSGAVIDWYDVDTNGTVLTGGSATNSYTTPTLSSSATYYAQARNTSTNCVSASRTAVGATVHTAPTAPTSLSTNVPAICNGVSTSATLTAEGGDLGSGAVYRWGKGATVGSDELATTSGNTYSVSPDAATTYWVQLVGTTSCTDATDGVTTSIAVHGAISAGAITTDSRTTIVGKAPGVTVKSSSGASGGSGNLAYEWRRTGTSSETLAGTAATYALNDDVTNYSTKGTYYFNRYAKDNTCTGYTTVAATGTYTLAVRDQNQLQGSCTFTQPPLLTTFANFSTTYSASTFVTLKDERDNNNYTVVKIGDRWIMAQNLNYQKNLTWQAKSDMPSSNKGSDLGLIGSFWCPGVSRSTSSAKASCDVWGALYSWETAMMLDGKGTWTEVTTNYCTGAASTTECKKNWGRNYSSGSSIGGRGICPEKWHVPTDHEWGIILDGMESGGGTAHQNASGYGWFGSNAGTRGSSKCKGEPSDLNPAWSTGAGTDAYGFRALPAGSRYWWGEYYEERGKLSIFWTSSAHSSFAAYFREISYSRGSVWRYKEDRCYGYAVRCIKD